MPGPAQHPAPSVRPNFAPLLAVASGDAQRRARYIADLLNFDWQHEFSDDGCVYRTARAELNRLRDEQRAIDPTGADWNRAAPPEYRIEVAA